jgi:Protein ChrB, N-terminal
MSGTAVLMTCDVLAGEQEVRAAFQAARNDEYEEIVDKCEAH